MLKFNGINQTGAKIGANWKLVQRYGYSMSCLGFKVHKYLGLGRGIKFYGLSVDGSNISKWWLVATRSLNAVPMLGGGGDFGGHLLDKKITVWGEMLLIDAFLVHNEVYNKVLLKHTIGVWNISWLEGFFPYWSRRG